MDRAKGSVGPTPRPPATREGAWPGPAVAPSESPGTPDRSAARHTSYHDFDPERGMTRFWWPTARGSMRWIPVIGSERFHSADPFEAEHYRLKIVRFLMTRHVLPVDPAATPEDLALEPWPERALALIEPVGQSHVIDLRPLEEREDDPVGPADLEGAG